LHEDIELKDGMDYLLQTPCKRSHLDASFDGGQLGRAEAPYGLPHRRYHLEQAGYLAPKEANCHRAACVARNLDDGLTASGSMLLTRETRDERTRG
jgi:hypothetical protein